MKSHREIVWFTRVRTCFGAVMAGFFTVSAWVGVAKAEDSLQTAPKTAERAVYDNDELFNQLSGAARTRAERKFGRKVPAGSKICKNGPIFGSSGGSDSDGPSRGRWPDSFLANNLVNDPTADATAQDTQSETTIVLGSGANVVCAFNDSGPFNDVSNPRFTGFSQSSNGGTSWVDKGSLPASADGDGGDPVLAFSAKTGTILLSTLSFNTAEKLLIFRSTNNGASFTGPINGAPGFDSTSGDHDKEWLTFDNFPGTGQGNAYLFWRNFGTPGGMTLTKSTDDGLTWGPGGGTVIANSGQGGQVVVGPDHTVYTFWYNISASPRRISMRKSTDFGVNFGSTFTVTTFIGTGANGDLALGGFRSSSFPQVVVNPVSGNLYIIYPDAAQDIGGDRGNIFFRQSTDGGLTWSSAVKVNNDNTLRAQFQPGIAVRPDGSALAAGWYDRRRDSADSLIERWAATATISGSTVTWGPNFRVSPQFPAVFGADSAVSPDYMGDYDQLAADNSFFYSTWGDNRDNSIAVPARKNANVRSAKFTLAGPGPILDSEFVTVTGGNGNGFVDANECNVLSLVIRNNGSSTATNISATLSTSTPGVIVFQSSSPYPDAVPGATSTNTISFQIATSPAFVCGTAVALSMTLTYGGGTDVATFSVPGAPYTVTQSSGVAIVPGTVATGNHGDDDTTQISLPFAYNFYGQSFTTATVCANGNLQFDTANPDFNNICLPAGSYNYAVFPFWSDLRTDGTVGVPQGIFTSTTGVAPNRIFNIEWRASYYSLTLDGNPVNFEVRLYEGQQRADIVYGVLNGTGSNATVGIQHGANFTQFECNSAALSTGLQLTFLPNCVDGGGTCQIPLPVIVSPARVGTNFVFSFATVLGKTYIVQQKTNVNDPTWQTNQTVLGDGTLKTVTNSTLAPSRRFFRLLVP